MDKKPTKKERMQEWIQKGIHFIFNGKNVSLTFPKDFPGNQKAYIRVLVKKDIKEYKEIHKEILASINVKPSGEIPSKNSNKNEKGQFIHGNKASPGRPEGSRSKITMAMRDIFEEGAQSLARKAMEMANGGDIGALKLCIERLYPPTKNKIIPDKFKELRTSTATELSESMDAVIQEFTYGEIDSEIAEDTMKLLTTKRDFIISSDFSERLKRLEQLNP